MGINGTAWAAQFSALANYLRGDAPLFLTPVGGGDAIAFGHDGIFRDVEDTEAGPLVLVRLEVNTETALALKGSYTYDSQTWEVVDQQGDKVGAGTGPRHYTLVRHAQ